MPRYTFACETCGLEFEVSRSMSEAGAEARCPADGARAARVFTPTATNFGRPASTPPRAPKASGFSHHGHRHGPGTGHHSHGPAAGSSSTA